MKNLNRVHLNGLRAIEAAGRLGSLAAAGEELNVTVGAISQHIIKAEAQLGHRVFERLPKGLQPTDFGRTLLPMLNDGFGRLNEAVGMSLRSDVNVLTISVAPVFAARWLAGRLDGFMARHPDIRLRLDATTHYVGPHDADVDLCIRVGTGDWPGMRCEAILDQFLFPVCAPELARQVSKAADLANLPAVIDANSMFSWDDWMQAAGLEGHKLATRHVFSQASLALDAVIAGQGVMLVWQTIAADAIADGRLAVPVPVRIPSGLRYYFCTRESARDTAKVRDFKQWMRTELDKSASSLNRLFDEHP